MQVGLIFIYIGSLIILSVIIGEIRFRNYLRKNFKSEEPKNTEKNNNKKNEEMVEKSISKGFYRSDIRPMNDCCNLDSYGLICLKCGRCGRKF